MLPKPPPQQWRSRSSHRGTIPPPGSQFSLDDASVAKMAAVARERRRAAAGAGGAPARSTRTRESAEHEASWAAFCTAPRDEIGMADIPWPPKAWHTLAVGATSAAEALCAELGLCAPAAAQREFWDAGSDPQVKAAVRAAMLRWHPDKFEQMFGTRLTRDATERAHIMECALHLQPFTWIDHRQYLKCAWHMCDKHCLLITIES